VRTLDRTWHTWWNLKPRSRTLNLERQKRNPESQLINPTTSTLETLETLNAQHPKPEPQSPNLEPQSPNLKTLERQSPNLRAQTSQQIPDDVLWHMLGPLPIHNRSRMEALVDVQNLGSVMSIRTFEECAELDEQCRTAGRMETLDVWVMVWPSNSL
jgi:hypothetical protein